MNLTVTLLAVHVLAVILWVGSLVSITRLLGVAKDLQGDARARVTDGARAVYRGVSSPWMGIALLVGLALIALTPGIFRMHWFHPKLTAALVMLALHFTLGVKVRKAQAAAGDDVAYAAALSSVRALQAGIFGTAAVAVSAVTILKVTMP
ncbi:MAG: CopD family protein [Polyangiales bacterium]